MGRPMREELALYRAIAEIEFKLRALGDMRAFYDAIGLPKRPPEGEEPMLSLVRPAPLSS